MADNDSSSSSSWKKLWRSRSIQQKRWQHDTNAIKQFSNMLKHACNENHRAHMYSLLLDMTDRCQEKSIVVVLLVPEQKAQLKLRTHKQ